MNLTSIFLRNFFNQFRTINRYKTDWKQPNGFDTGIKIYNSITKTKEPFIINDKNVIKWYSCGPTVYDQSHIGHACYFMKLDIIQRILKNYFNFNLVSVMNITDIDDKIIKKSLESKPAKSCEEITKFYEQQFLGELDQLGISRPNILLRVTDNIEVIKQFIEGLIERNLAYRSEDGVYFDLNNYGNYGKFQTIITDETTTNDSEEIRKIKRNPSDFALWKLKKVNLEPSWSSNWGPGRPGWHVECSALASHVFGATIDVHAGGFDLKFPHHENEEAQSCAYHCKDQWVNYWLHTGLLHLKNTTKMSKSLQNTIKIQELVEKIDSSSIFRLACLMSHYRSDLEFSWDFMETARNLLGNYKNFLNNCHDYSLGYLKVNANPEVLTQLLIKANETLSRALIDDFNTPLVIDNLNQIITIVNSMFKSAGNTGEGLIPQILALGNFVRNTLNIFGIEFESTAHSLDDRKFVEIVTILNNFRQDLRQYGLETRNSTILKLCDRVRDDLKKCGVNIKDHGKLSSWNY